MGRKKLPLSPLLQADPATLPRYRKGAGDEGKAAALAGTGGGLLAYIREVMPGPPPLGWRDITPYFGTVPNTVGQYKIMLSRYGYHIAIQTVIDQGQRYRRVAVVLAPHTPTRKQ